MADAADAALRLDLWLYFTRLFRTRALAQERIAGGGIRINGEPCRKPHRLVRPGDVLTVSAQGRVRVVTAGPLPARRGPAPEAQACYVEDAAPPGPVA